MEDRLVLMKSLELLLQTKTHIGHGSKMPLVLLIKYSVHPILGKTADAKNMDGSYGRTVIIS